MITEEISLAEAMDRTITPERAADERALLAMEEKIGVVLRDHGIPDEYVEGILELMAEYANATSDARLRWRLAVASAAQRSGEFTDAESIIDALESQRQEAAHG